jgi:isocitrate lyase
LAVRVVDDPLHIVFCVADIDVGFAGGGETQVNPMLKELFDEYP